MADAIQSTQKSGTNWITVIITIIALAFMGLYFNKCNEHQTSTADSINLINALRDSVRHLQNKDSSNTALISITQTSNKELADITSDKDSALAELQKQVTTNKSKLKSGSSVTVGHTETVYNIKDSTILLYDTIKNKEGTVKVYPTYSDQIHNRWLDFDVIADKFRVVANIKVKNDFTAVVGYEGKKPYIELTTQNPYTSVSKLRTYQITIPKPKQFGIGIAVGITYIDKFRPAITAGITWTPIRF